VSLSDPFDIDAQRTTRSKALAEERRVQNDEERDFKWLMSSTQGRRIVWRLLEQAGVFRSSFSTNSMQMAFNEGFRSYGLKMVNLIQRVTPELYSTLQKENTNARNTDDGNAANSN
jgi:hypothetical protein